MIDTTIRFNDHNSYKVTTPLFCYPFGVESMTHITHSFQAYATSSLASATRARTKFFDADGATISDVSHSFAVTTVFGAVEITVAVPATAVQAQLVLLQGGTDWWIAEPKSEQGEISTPYNVNYQGQLTYITPNGIYTGMLTASQIVVTGTTASPTEDLEQRLVTISNGQINLSSTLSAKTTKITNEGVYTGEIVATQITSGYISTDRLSAKSITGAKLADGTVSDINIATGISATKVTTGKLQSVDGKTWFDLTKPEIVQTATIDGKAIRVEMSPTNPFKLSIAGKNHIYVTGTSGFSGANVLVTSKYDINQDGRVDENDLRLIMSYLLGIPGTYPPTSLMDVDGDGLVTSADANQIFLHATVNSKITTGGGRQLGVDNTGVYTSTNWGDTKSYVHTF